MSFRYPASQNYCPIIPLAIELEQHPVIDQVKQNGLFDTYEYFKGWKLLLIDGAHHYSSQQVHCDQCQERQHEDGTITYSHSMLARVIAHPAKKEVLPLCEETIIKQDGQTKNDCELNVAKRLIKKVSRRYLSKNLFL